jgi:hypothetical protein
MGEWRDISIILNLDIRDRRVLSFRPLRFIPGETVPSTHWIGGRADPRGGLEVMDKTKISCLYQEWNRDSTVIQLVASPQHQLSYPGSSSFKTVLLGSARKENNLQKRVLQITVTLPGWPPPGPLFACWYGSTANALAWGANGEIFLLVSGIYILLFCLYSRPNSSSEEQMSSMDLRAVEKSFRRNCWTKRS